MAKTKTLKVIQKSKTHPTIAKKMTSTLDAPTLLKEATSYLHTSSPDLALPLALEALRLSTAATNSKDHPASLPALTLVGEIYVELGSPQEAQEVFLRAVSLDPEGTIPESQGGGAEKFLWLAQLCDEGGEVSVQWFEKGVKVLRREIGELEGDGKETEESEEVVAKRERLAEALCGVIEIYMTDLSWEEDAESRCETLITEALLISPSSPSVLQTLASIRISQERFDDARAALTRSLALWKDLPPEDLGVPDFPTRVSLSRLLIEVEMYEVAVEVLERLIGDDDNAVEVWYLGGWCLYLMGKKDGVEENGEKEGEGEGKALWIASREWLQNALKLYEMLEYEDERLHEHAIELVKELDGVLGEIAAEDFEEDADGVDGEWGSGDEDEDEQEDHEMAGT